MRNKKAVFIIPNLQGNGAEKFVLSIYNGLNKLKGVECHIVCFEDRIEHNLPPDINLHVVTPPDLKGLKRLFKRKEQAKFIEGYINRVIGPPDIILSNLTSADKITKHFDSSNVYHVIHSTTSIEHLKNRTGLKRLIAKIKIERIYSRHNRICVSQGAAKDLSENFRLPGVNHVIYNPVNIEEVSALSKYEPPSFSDKDYFVHIGKFNDAKRHDRLINAYKISNIEQCLVLLGKGPKEKQIRDLVEELDLSDKVIFAGHQKNPYPTLAHAKGLILSSDYEGLPTVILEALSVGVPVISTDCNSGPREILPPISLSDLNERSLAEKIRQLSNETEKFKCELDKKFLIQTAVDEYYSLII